jgi:hypothetical protein
VRADLGGWRLGWVAGSGRRLHGLAWVVCWLQSHAAWVGCLLQGQLLNAARASRCLRQASGFTGEYRVQVELRGAASSLSEDPIVPEA